MSTPQLKELLEDRALVVPLSVEQYHRMIETGILESGQPIELLDGFLVRKDRSATGANPMTVGPSHAWVIDKLASSCAGLPKHGCYLRVQQPITLPPDNEPEPDGAIVRGSPDEYRDRHPGPGDILCLFEVADSSLQRDRVTKQRIYADAGIPLYVIVNVMDRVVEVHHGPLVESGRYGKLEPRHRGSSVQIVLPDATIFELPVDEILP